MRLYQNLLTECGIADTRTQTIAEALQQLHYAVSMLDQTNRTILARINPYAVAAAVDYAAHEELETDLWGHADPDECLNGESTGYEIVFVPEFEIDKTDTNNSEKVVNIKDYL